MPLLPTKKSKPVLSSRTAKTAIAAILGSAVPLVLHYVGAVELGSGPLSTAWTTLVTSGAMLGLRFLKE